MSLVPDEGRPGELWAVMGCFVGYKFQGGGIYRVREGSAAARVLDLPFAHRLGVVARKGVRYLLAANLAEDKRDAADWSRPGAVYAVRLDEGTGAAPLELRPILSDLHKNHGFLLAPFEGRGSLLIGAAEGLFVVDVDAVEGWPSRQVLAKEVSEMAMFDLDGDGADELVTIEPFHGNVLRAYRPSAKGWSPFWESELAFGHCVLAGIFDGRRSIIVSNRADSRDLILFQFDEGASSPRRIVVDEGPGAANMLVLSVHGRDMLFSANQAEGEIAVYAVRRG
jgi:hypothetical protein